ncbi:RNase H domain-containing protein [Trichonephila clavipes]|uniref:RNase H domain-containing protein n=1 Tax=Trichonephila clavipes TaxID=2585209 RepID=A0A8X6RNC6_TRICX|nr:RNase H domain-containing protein [Trichonephila clavipes]
MGKNTGVAILEKVRRIFYLLEGIHLQWFPLHVNIADNEIIDTQTKDEAAQLSWNSAPLTYSELHSPNINNKQSTILLLITGMTLNALKGGSLSFQCSRQEQIILTHLQSGYLRTLNFKDRNKVFPTCVRCSACQASPEHFLDYLGFSKQDLYEGPLMVLDFLRVIEITDLVF